MTSGIDFCDYLFDNTFFIDNECRPDNTKKTLSIHLLLPTDTVIVQNFL